MANIYNIKDGDWTSVRQAIAKLSTKLGPRTTPVFNSVKLTDLTATRLVQTDSTKILASVTDLTSWIAGTTNEITISDDGDGTLTIGISDPLIVAKGGSGAATFTDHSILLGSGTGAFTALGVATNGQLPIGSTGNDPVLAAITEGEGIDISNGAGSITISGEDASTTNKGIASFNSTNFSVSSGAVNTIQNIATDSSPTFTDLTLSSPSNIYSLSHDSFADFVSNEHIDHTSITISGGTGLTGSGTIDGNVELSLSHLGIESLSDPNADKILFWDDSETKTDWLGLGNSVAITTTTFDTIQDIRTTASPQFVLITLTGTPSVSTDSVNKAYADSLVGGAFWNNVAVATIANVDLSSGLEAGDSIDDYTLVEGDRVLVKSQTDETENGLYVVPASGAASRATDADEEAEILNKKCIPINGALTAKHLYFCVNSSITIGVTDIEFAELTTVADHNSLSALQGGQAGPPTEYYHFTSAQYTELAAIAALGTAADKYLYTTGTDTWAEGAITTAGRAILDDADASAQRTTLGLAIGSDVQAHDTGLDNLAALTYVSDSFIKVTATDTYAIRTIAETKTDLSLDAVENTALSTWAGTSNITTLGTIGTGTWEGTSISTTYTDAKCTATWPNTYTSDQDLQQADSPTFAALSLGTGELTCGSINRGADTLTLEIGGTAELSLTSTTATFGGNIIIPDSGTIGSASDVDVMTIDASGNTTFSVFPITPSAAPDADYEVANKKYVDDNGGGTALLGDGTAGRTVRIVTLTVEDGTNANTIKCTLVDTWNGDAIAATDNIAKNATTGNYYLTSSGQGLRILDTGLSGNPLAVFPSLTFHNASAAYNPVFVTAKIETSPSDSMEVGIRLSSDGSAQDWTAVQDDGTITRTDVTLLYLTDA